MNTHQMTTTRAVTSMETLIATLLIAKTREHGIPDVDVVTSLDTCAVEQHTAGILAMLGVRVDMAYVKVEIRRLLTN